MPGYESATALRAVALCCMRYGSRYLSGGNAVAGGCCRSPGLYPTAVARNCLIGCFCPLAGRWVDRRAGIGPERGFQSIVTGCLRCAKLRASASLNGVENERACSGHPLTQAQQRIQRAGSVCSSSPFAMAPFGQSRTQRPQPGAACGIGHGQQRDGISALAAAVFQDETDKAQHGKQRGPGCPQALEGDGRDPASREFPSYGTAERLGTGRIVGIRPTCGDGVGGCAI